MDDVRFTAGITFSDDQVKTVDVTSLDGEGIGYTDERGAHRVAWSDIKAVMLATTDHMLESAGSLFTMAERLQEGGDEGSQAADEMRRFGARLLQQAAPLMCPLGGQCALRPGPARPGYPGSPN